MKTSKNKLIVTICYKIIKLVMAFSPDYDTKMVNYVY